MSHIQVCDITCVSTAGRAFKRYACKLHTVVIDNQGILKMPSNLLKSILDATTGEVSEMAIEYGQLISLPELTEAQGDRLQEILDYACNNGALSFWLVELDHIIGHQTGLLNPDFRKDYDNKKALLKEYFTEFLESSSADKSPKEVRTFLESYSEERSNPDFLNPLSSQKRVLLGVYGYQIQASQGHPSDSSEMLTSDGDPDSSKEK